MGTIPQGRLEEVRFLYYDHKLSALQIAQKLGVSLDAVYYFMRHHQLARRNCSENDAIRFAAKPPSFNLRASLNARQDKLKTMGVMLYWAEGYKAASASCVDFANSNPAMIKLFAKFLREICGISDSKLHGYLYCYANQDPGQLTEFWSDLTGIPKTMFTKPYIRNDFDIRKKDKMRYGLLHLRYYDKKLLVLLLQWIAEYATM